MTDSLDSRGLPENDRPLALEALAVYRPRQPGALRLVELARGDPAKGQPSLVVQFEVPDGLKLAEAEAAAHEAIATISAMPAAMNRYGFEAKALTDLQVAALAKIITATESALLLWRDWNFATLGPDGQAAKRTLDVAAIAELMGEPQIRAAWLIHLDNASPLERAEGNVSGASPNTSSGAAPPTATDAKPARRRAPKGSPTRPPGGSAPGKSSRRGAPKGS